MNDFSLKGSITDENVMIHALNNLPKDYDVILGLENCNMVTGDNILTIDVIHEKLNHQYKQIKNKKREKRKRKSFGCIQ